MIFAKLWLISCFKTNENTGEKSNSESQSFETFKCNIPYNTSDILLDKSCKADVKFFSVNFQKFDMPYLLPESFHDFLDNTPFEYFSILHLKVRIIKKPRNFKSFLTSINFTYSVKCFSETCLDDLTLSWNASYKLPNYTSKPQVRHDRKDDDISIYVYNSLNFKIRPDLIISNNNIEWFSAEIVCDKVRNTIGNVLYRPPNGQIGPFETFLNNAFSQIKVSIKTFYIAGDFNLNQLDHDTNRKVQNFANLSFQNGMILTINKLTRLATKAAMVIDHILFKSDISNQFPIWFLVPSSSSQRENKTTFVHKIIFNTELTESFKKKLHETDWEETGSSKNPQEAYTTFLQKFIVLYHNYFPKNTLNWKQKI